MNVLPPKHHPEEQVNVVYLTTLTKAQILKQWEQSLTYPDRFVVTKAESVKKLSEDIPAKDLKTLGQYLDDNKIILDESEYHKLATIVADKYRETYGINPRRVSRMNAEGKWNNKSYAYDDSDFPLIEECLLSVNHSRHPH
ncbi:MAG: hypothetical protein KME59_21520 [Trichormus sp. ATA11-4-KO1]|nr:hypothetical protein [Trichormus sp. ATA11-4-KO1]